VAQVPETLCHPFSDVFFDNWLYWFESDLGLNAGHGMIPASISAWHTQQTKMHLSSSALIESKDLHFFVEMVKSFSSGFAW
jgi:hypothetical protein